MASLKHPDSKFTEFELPLANGGITTGIHYIPPVRATATSYRPLMILLHGAGFTAHHFDINATNTASLAADAFSFPVVSINRPGYKSSPSFLPIPETSTYYQEAGRWLCQYILPELWQEFGIPNRCSSMVLFGHSCAAGGMLICAGIHAQESSPKFPLAGLIFSGWGCELSDKALPAPIEPSKEANLVRNQNMFSDPKFRAVDPGMLQYCDAQYYTYELPEVMEVVTPVWETYWHKYANEINVPIMFCNGEHDNLWVGTMEHVKRYEAMFPKCPRFDGSILKGAPHAIEWSRFAQGWYARVFGFALEVAAWKAIQDEIK